MMQDFFSPSMTRNSSSHACHWKLDKDLQLCPLLSYPSPNLQLNLLQNVTQSQVALTLMQRSLDAGQSAGPKNFDHTTPVRRRKLAHTCVSHMTRVTQFS